MITNIELARALHDDRQRRAGERHHDVDPAPARPLRRAVGRSLERLGRRLQGPAQPSQSCV